MWLSYLLAKINGATTRSMSFWFLTTASWVDFRVSGNDVGLAIVMLMHITLVGAPVAVLHVARVWADSHGTRSGSSRSS